MKSRSYFSSKPVINRVKSVIFRTKCGSSVSYQEELVSFLKNNFSEDEIYGLYYEENLKNFVVKFTNTETYSKRVWQSYTHTYGDGRVVQYVAQEAGNFIHTVKLCNVPFEIDDDLLRQSCEGFGKIHEIHEEFADGDDWKIRTGNKIVTMETFYKLPMRVEIAGQKIKVQCTSLMRVCFFCGKDSQLSKNCKESRNLKTRKFNEDSVSEGEINGKKLKLAVSTETPVKQDEEEVSENVKPKPKLSSKSTQATVKKKMTDKHSQAPEILDQIAMIKDQIDVETEDEWIASRNRNFGISIDSIIKLYYDGLPQHSEDAEEN